VARLAPRLDRLAARWGAAGRPTDPRLAEFLDDFIDAPVLPGVLWAFCAARAASRSAKEVGDGVVVPGRGVRLDVGAWFYLPEGEREQRTQREWADLERHQRALGAEAGWAAWMAEAAGWPPSWRGIDQAAFDRAYAHELAVRANHRRDAVWAAWRRRTGWREGMAYEEEAAFDRGLLARRAGR
jgi:hypothetical protein